MQIEQAAKLRDYIIAGKWVDGGNYALSLIGNPASCKTKQQALVVCQSLFQHLLDQEMYLHAATLQWGPDIFNTEPESVRRVFKSMHENATILLMGASSMSKTYSAGAWMLLDYLRDPLYTTVKLAAVNEDHLRKNLFAHVATLYRGCCIPSKFKIEIRDSDLWMGVKEAGFEFGISGIAFKQSQETSGQFKGYKAKPVIKPKPHPKFGYMSRLRVLGDEGQNWPGGPFKDFNSIIASKSGSEMVKVCVAFNPESISQLVVQMAEPVNGWAEEDMDTLYDYKSNHDWAVCRLDAARSENVIQRKVIYPGLQTYEGFMSYLRAGGDTSANYSTFARGWPPMKGTVNTIIPPTWPQEARGEATFIETPVNLAAVDLAFMGLDSAQMAVGRWGLASGWEDSHGKFHQFMDRLNVSQARPRHVLQIDQILPMQKHDDAIKMAEEIIGRAKQLDIKPEWLAVDKTSIGFGTFSHLRRVWGEVIGISWNEKATDNKILAEDTDPASKQCDGVMSELWWAFRRWLDPRACAILINPIIPPQPIHTQLTSRRYETGKNGIKVEPKEKYKARNKSSPDEADALVMLVHVVRITADVLPGLVEHKNNKNGQNNDPEMRFVSAAKSGSLSMDDSMCSDGVEEESFS